MPDVSGRSREWIRIEYPNVESWKIQIAECLCDSGDPGVNGWYSRSVGVGVLGVGDDLEKPFYFLNLMKCYLAFFMWE